MTDQLFTSILVLLIVLVIFGGVGVGVYFMMQKNND